MANLLDKIKGSLIGGAIGDALGYQIEFERIITDKQCSKFEGIGLISDDTQMTLFTANALIYFETNKALKNNKNLIDTIYLAYKDWYDTQYFCQKGENICWIKDIKELNVRRAPGNTCLSALESNTMGTFETILNNSKGCGGIMRVAPIGLFFENEEIAGEIGAKAAAITHSHPLGIIPSYIFTALISLVTHTDIDLEKAIYKAIEKCKNKFNIYDYSYYNEAVNLIEKAIRLSKENNSDVESIEKIGEGWTAEETLAIAIYSCLKYQNNFSDAIICAINHSGDSDSTGAVAGNILGAYLGYENIDSYYKNNIELKDIILELASDLYESKNISKSTINTPKWSTKYIKI